MGFSLTFVRLIGLSLLLLVFCQTSIFAQQPLTASLRPKLNVLLFGGLDFRERQHMGDYGFAKAQAASHLNLQILDRFSIFSEITLTRKRGNTDFIFVVERLFARYDYSDQYKLSFGRYHTPIGYWNSAFHHGSWLQTTVDRPETMKFGSNIVPIHFVGGLLEGNIGQSNFSYRAGFGNARSDEINEVENNFDNIYSHRAGILGVVYRSTGRNRFEAGTNMLIDKATTAAGQINVDEIIFNGYVVLLNETPEIILEYTHAYHDSRLRNGSVNSVYGQFAYRLASGGGKFKPYVRAEYIGVTSTNPLLGALNLDYNGILGGVRWDFLPSAAMKVEVRNEKFEGRDRSTSFWLQLSFVLDVNRLLHRTIRLIKQ